MLCDDKPFVLFSSFVVQQPTETVKGYGKKHEIFYRSGFSQDIAELQSARGKG